MRIILLTCLPIFKTVAFTAFVHAHSCGAAPDFNRIPLALKHSHYFTNYDYTLKTQVVKNIFLVYDKNK